MQTVYRYDSSSSSQAFIFTLAEAFPMLTGAAVYSRQLEHPYIMRSFCLERERHLLEVDG